MANQQFGGAHTDKKLGKLEAYLKAYSTALKHQGFRLIYFDAFAGTGDIQIARHASLLGQVDEYSPFIAGSVHRALELRTAFDEYVFVEKSRAKAKDLQSLKATFPGIANRISIRIADANNALVDFCNKTDWRKARAVVFLDPYGNQVKWTTIEVIAKTQAVDLWYLFPAGLGVHRQIGNDAKVDPTHQRSLDKLLGTPDWRTAFIETRQTDDLFGTGIGEEKVATPASITHFMIGRMRKVFKGGVLDEWLPLGARGIHMYSLLFAWANPSEKAKLAGKLARAVLGNKARGRTK